MARKRHRIGNMTIWIPNTYERVKLPWKRKWIAALRSGKFSQSRCLLFDAGKYCCLGILSKIQGRLVGSFDSNATHSTSVLHYSNPCWPTLNGQGSFDEKIRVTIPTGTGKPKILTTLAECNDNGVPFKDIASLIHLLWKE